MPSGSKFYDTKIHGPPQIEAGRKRDRLTRSLAESIPINNPRSQKNEDVNRRDVERRCYGGPDSKRRYLLATDSGGALFWGIDVWLKC